MWHGECINCGRNGWLSEKHLCQKCVKGQTIVAKSPEIDLDKTIGLPVHDSDGQMIGKVVGVVGGMETLRLMSDKFGELLRSGKRLRFQEWPENHFIYAVRGTMLKRNELRHPASKAMHDHCAPSPILTQFGRDEPIAYIQTHIDKNIGDGRIQVGWTPNVMEMFGAWEVCEGGIKDEKSHR